MASNDGDILQQLYERFRQALQKPVAERFFDEDELTEIFDYAGDINDDYVRAEVLFCGERLYPESDELRVRRAIFYSECMNAPDAFAGYMEDNDIADSGLMWKMAGLLASPPEDSRIDSALSELLDSADILRDEETIRLIKLGQSLGAMEWLMSRENDIRRKSNYLSVALYEYGCLYYEARMWKEAAVRFEELTQLEPFESTYWALYFSSLAFQERFDEAREAFEFASNLETSDPESAVILSTVCEDERLADLRPRVLEILTAALTNDPSYFRTYEAYAKLNVIQGHPSEASIMLNLYSEMEPRSPYAVKLAAQLGLDITANLFSRYITATKGTGFGLEDVLRIAYLLMEQREYEQTMDIVSGYARYSDPSPELISVYTEAAFLNKNYSNVLMVYDTPEAVLEMLGDPLRGSRAALLYYRSLLALGRDPEARDFAAAVRRRMADIIPMLDPLNIMIFRGLMAEMQ